MKTKRILGLVVLLLFSLQITTFAAQAPENEAEFIDFEIMDYQFQGPIARTTGLVVMEFTLGKTNDGKLSVSFITAASAISKEIGVEDMRLQRRTWYGTWETIRSTNPVAYNTSGCSGGYYYLNPSSGTTYRVVGTHYAIINGVRYEEFHISGSFTY